MQLRFKTYSEFLKGITIAYSENGCTIICKLKSFVLLDTKFKPWDTPATRKSFLVKMYAKQVLAKCNPSKKIKRIPGYEMLGKRCMHQDELSIICDAVELVDTQTGEQVMQYTIFNHWVGHPFKVFENQIQK